MVSIIVASERLGVSPERVRQMCRTGQLVAEKLGRDWFVAEASITAEQSRRRCAESRGEC